MGTRLRRAIGYGLTWSAYKRFTRLKGDYSELLHDKFAALTDADLTIPETVLNEIWNHPPPRPPAIIDKRLLTTEYAEDTNGDVPLAPATDLYRIASTPDHSLAIIFFPNVKYAKEWSRWDNSIDYAFEQWREFQDDGVNGKTVADPKRQAEPRNFLIQPRYGFYPYTNMLMTTDGKSVEWDWFGVVEKHPEWVPAVPSEIRWYLTRHGVLTNHGVNQLRPMIAQWWT